MVEFNVPCVKNTSRFTFPIWCFLWSRYMLFPQYGCMNGIVRCGVSAGSFEQSCINVCLTLHWKQWIGKFMGSCYMYSEMYYYAIYLLSLEGFRTYTLYGCIKLHHFTDTIIAWTFKEENQTYYIILYSIQVPTVCTLFSFGTLAFTKPSHNPRPSTHCEHLTRNLWWSQCECEKCSQHIPGELLSSALSSTSVTVSIP